MRTRTVKNRPAAQPGSTRPAPLAITAGPVRPQPVPAGVDPGSVAVAEILDEITPIVVALGDRLRQAPPAGFLVTAADVQRREVMLDLLDRAARVLAERV